MKFINFYLILSLLIIVSCSKDDNNCEGGETSRKQIEPCIENFKFDIGSFWVYQDTSTLQIDSVYLSAVNHEWEKTPSNSDCPDDYYSVESYEATLNSSTRGTLNELLANNRIYDPNRTSSGTGMLVKYNCNTVLLLDSIVINNTMYYNVLESQVNNGAITFYYKGDFGILRRIENGSTHDLINHHVVPN